jgi:hypothetical protein
MKFSAWEYTKFKVEIKSEEYYRSFGIKSIEYTILFDPAHIRDYIKRAQLETARIMFQFVFDVISAIKLLWMQTVKYIFDIRRVYT